MTAKKGVIPLDWQKACSCRFAYDVSCYFDAKAHGELEKLPATLKKAFSSRSTLLTHRLTTLLKYTHEVHRCTLTVASGKLVFIRGVAHCCNF